MRVTITTANICGNPLRIKRAVRRRMRRALRQPDVVFGQEIARSNRWRPFGRPGNYSKMWHHVAAVYDKTTFGGPHEVPISVPTGWEILGSEVVKVHGGKRRVSPARYITTVRVDLAGQLVAFVNCHPVSKPRRGVSSSRWRIARWDQYRARLDQIVTGLHDEGYTVVFGGDMNKRHVPRIHPEQRQMIHRGLDHLWIVPAAGTTATVTRRRRVGRTVLMDHPILTATVDIRETS